MKQKKNKIFAFLISCMLVTCVTGYAEEINVSRKRSEPWSDPPYNIGGAIISTKQIVLKDYPKAFNPSLIQVPEGFVLVFRHYPYPNRLWISDMGVVLLNHNLEQVSEPVLLNNRQNGDDTIPNQGEDARIFQHKGKLYLIYNDNREYECPSMYERRDMYIAELIYEGGTFSLCEPTMVYHDKKYDKVNWQKNWVPFSYQNSILLSYSILPHEILCPNFSTGACEVCYETVSKCSWKWGTLRGGTPACLINGEYLAFFHSSTITKSSASRGRDMWHYYMGAYTFSAEPPFHITKMTSSPLVGEKFYTHTNCSKRVIFPGGFALVGSKIYLAYGKDDAEMWIATLDYNRLKKVLMPLKN